MFVSWFTLVSKAALLGFEAQNVIALRFMRFLAGGVPGQAETIRMITEKMAAFTEVQIIGTTAAVTGQSANVTTEKILRKYRKRVGANRRRLAAR